MDFIEIAKSMTLKNKVIFTKNQIQQIAALGEKYKGTKGKWKPGIIDHPIYVGKMGELGLYNMLKGCGLDVSEVDFTVYENGGDRGDLFCNGRALDSKARARNYGKLYVRSTNEKKEPVKIYPTMFYVSMEVLSDNTVRFVGWRAGCELLPLPDLPSHVGAWLNKESTDGELYDFPSLIEFLTIKI